MRCVSWQQTCASGTNNLVGTIGYFCFFKDLRYDTNSIIYTQINPEYGVTNIRGPGIRTGLTKKLVKLLGHFIGFWAVSLRNYWTVRWKPHSSAPAGPVQLEYLTVVISSHKTRAGQAGTLPLHTLRKQQISSPP